MKNKPVSMLLVVSILLLCFSFPSYAASAIPDGVTKEEITQAITKTDSVLSGLISSGAIDIDLKQTVYAIFTSDDTANSVFTALYTAFSENEDTFKLIGVDISLANVASCLKNYPEVYALLTSKASWADVFSYPLTCKWGLETGDDFGTALSDMMRPFNEILFILLCSGSTTGIVSVQGADGYTNAVVPLLQAAGCPSIMSQADYTAAATQNRAAMVKNAVSMLLAAVDYILELPVERLCEYLPCIAHYLSNGGIAESANALIAPIVIKIGIIPLSGLDKLIEKSGVFTNSEDLTSMFTGMDMNTLSDGEVGFTMPEIDLTQLAQCTQKTESGYETDKESAFVTILDFAIEAVKMNKDSMGEIPAEMADMIDTLTQKSNSELIKSLVALLCFGKEDAVQDYQWQYPAYTPQAVAYPENMTRDNFVRTLGMIDDTLSQFLVEFVQQPPLSKTISNAIYSSSTLTMLTTGIYSALDGDEVGSLLDIIGMDFSVDTVADIIEEYCPSAASSLRKYDEWEKVKSIDWGIKDGKRKGFEKCLNAVLLPMSKLLDVILSEGSISVFGAVDIYGSDGYNTAVIPVLEAFGCKADGIKAYSEYLQLNDLDRICAVTLPVFDLIDEIINAPVVTLCNILPNIAYFLTNGSLKTVISNLLYPVTAMLEKAGLSDMLPKEMTELDFDINTVFTEAMSSADLGFELKAPDLTKVASLGTASVLQSAATFNGTASTFTYITADAPAVLVTAARYIVDAVNSSDLDMMGGMMDGMTGGDDAGVMSMYTDTFTNQLEGKTTDQLIEWIYNLLFAETPQREEEPVNDFIPTIKYVPVKDNKNIIAGVAAALVFVLIVATIIFVAKHDFSSGREKRKEKRKAKKEANV